MKTKIVLIVAMFCFVILMTASSSFNHTLYHAGTNDSIRFVVPENFPQPVYQFENNRVTRAGFELGRMLFYDPNLSKDRSISCADCHQSFAAFANLDHMVSHGVDECMGTRNA